MSRGFRDADTTQALSNQAIAAAIDKIVHPDDPPVAHGADGLCIDCGNDIGSERLSALPNAVRCVGCQAAWESSNRF